MGSWLRNPQIRLGPEMCFLAFPVSLLGGTNWLPDYGTNLHCDVHADRRNEHSYNLIRLYKFLFPPSRVIYHI